VARGKTQACRTAVVKDFFKIFEGMDSGEDTVVLENSTIVCGNEVEPTTTEGVLDPTQIDIVEPRAARRHLAARMKTNNKHWKTAAKRKQQIRASTRTETTARATRRPATATKTRTRLANQFKGATTKSSGDSTRVWDTTRTEREGGGSPMKTTRFRRKTSRVWDTARTEREGGGSPMKTARFRETNTNSNNVTDWAISM
jgi:hypothetical protein